jgi:hypothetical protein
MACALVSGEWFLGIYITPGAVAHYPIQHLVQFRGDANDPHDGWRRINERVLGVVMPDNFVEELEG